MNIEKTEFEGLIVLTPKVFDDNRGCFFESFNEKIVSEIIPNTLFVQDNISISKKNVIRGLHLQEPPYAQGKLVTVLKGKVIDIVVDVRKNSPTYGQYYSIELSSENKNLLYIPIGFAHGFVSLEDESVFMYKCTNFYSKESEVCINWNDPNIKINWGINNPILSEKDNNNCILLRNYNSPF
ncbi:MAG: dTDP-4-dehydrorhamnose 3,5-epimerase [Bacteroidetes bacterium GWE2_29_8]|nr:MAG: dTDP-4-dehydrorhamnose 3,5-epimerase [Bacteroidetes bacterium GWE2_29_8]OFY16158.1 MAG: dTDP-4-dehydrorhamnose 3,5-epimerase [Bacteroidetes bacterium GWF2_29_10]